MYQRWKTHFVAIFVALFASHQEVLAVNSHNGGTVERRTAAESRIKGGNKLTEPIPYFATFQNISICGGALVRCSTFRQSLLYA